jgi:hypothetical protein
MARALARAIFAPDCRTQWYYFPGATHRAFYDQNYLLVQMDRQGRSLIRHIPRSTPRHLAQADRVPSSCSAISVAAFPYARWDRAFRLADTGGVCGRHWS